MLAYNTRFLIFPWVHVPHLASHSSGADGAADLRGLAEAVRPPGHFLETFVDPERYRGTCYYAANWVHLGRTTGRGNNAKTWKATLPIKDVLGYPLRKDFRQRLAKIGD
ncbi:hypothetical protein B1B_16252 [mine drainage metagenome]|uniref:Uncharacterized protein n=1 Tax=mine drainage metagenome TaxID=410659 RepID=T0YVP4_9ZZZZ